MGGSAFGPGFPSTRISTSAYHALVARLIPLLAPCFPRIEHLRFLDDKETHGDVDILCSWQAPEWAFIPIHKNSTVGDVARAEAERGRKEFVDEVAKVVGAVRWRTSAALMGSLEIHLGIPCSAVEDMKGSIMKCEKERSDESTIDHEWPFYQVDLLLCPPKYFDFRMFNGSYSTTNIILGQAVRGIAYELTLREEDFILCHSPIDEVPRVDIVLTSDITDFCDWLGLDYARWQQGFADRNAFWQFIVTVPINSKMAYSLRGLAWKWRSGYTAPVGCRPRVEEMVEYYAFLQTTQWAPPAGTIDPASVGTINPSPTFNPYKRSSPRHAYPLEIPVSELTDIVVLGSEIDKPSQRQLAKEALDALGVWGVRTDYFDLVAERREIKRVILQSRLGKVRREVLWQKIKLLVVALGRVVWRTPRRMLAAVKGWFRLEKKGETGI